MRPLAQVAAHPGGRTRSFANGSAGGPGPTELPRLLVSRTTRRVIGWPGRRSGFCSGPTTKGSSSNDLVAAGAIKQNPRPARLAPVLALELGDSSSQVDWPRGGQGPVVVRSQEVGQTQSERRSPNASRARAPRRKRLMLPLAGLAVVPGPEHSRSVTPQPCACSGEGRSVVSSSKGSTFPRPQRYSRIARDTRRRL